jgi:hypothetical protein
VISWIDLIASDAEPYGKGKHHMSVSAKKTRQMETTIDRLAKEELVELARTSEPGTRKYEGFVLMHEGGRRRPHGPNIPYQVPVVPPEQAFPVPVTLFTNGWIHILEDSELAFILMMAAVHHATGGQVFTITAEDRLLRFGMKHDGYEAHMMQVDPTLAKDAADYYIQASESGGEPPGRWWGPGAQGIGLEPGQVVERGPYDLLFGEHKAPDGTLLGRPPGGGRKAADIYAGLLAAESHATAERKRELRLEASHRRGRARSSSTSPCHCRSRSRSSTLP